MSDEELVFSTDGRPAGRCPHCGGRHAAEACPEAPVAVVPAETTLRLRLETKRRGGKAVTVVYDLPHAPAHWQALAKRLKARAGTGGAYKAGRIEIQGDRREAVRRLLEGEGYRVKGGG